MNATTIQNVVTYNTTIAFDNPDLRLFPGMTAYASIPVATAKDVVKIPNGALRFKPDMTDSERKSLYAKYNIDDSARATTAGRIASAGGGSATGAAGASGATGGAASRPAIRRRAAGANARLGGRAGGGGQGAGRWRRMGNRQAGWWRRKRRRARTASGRIPELSGSCFRTRLSSLSRCDSA